MLIFVPEITFMKKNSCLFKEYIYILLNGEISPIILKDVDSDELIELILPMKTY